MEIPKDCRYLESHEWHRIDGEVCTIGISQFAADELTDITFVSLPPVGREVGAGGSFGEVESVKATSELMSGLAGVVAEINEKLNDSPELINEDPFGEGWIIKLKVSDAAAYDSLLSPEDYQAKLSL